MQMNVTGIIPARYASTRFPGKPLALIRDRPMIQHVYERSRRAESLSRVVVATDDRRILDTVLDFGGEAVMTSSEHPTGTDRLGEVAALYPEIDIMVNIQGDEPLIHPQMIDAAVAPLLEDRDLVMSTLKKRIDDSYELESPHVVKVVTDVCGNALYFSRTCIPSCFRGEVDVYRHIGLYVYRREFLLTFIDLERSRLERAEGLEQLRALENGYRIRVVETAYSTVGVDVPSDLEKVKRVFEEGDAFE